MPLTDKRDGCVMFALMDRPGTYNQPHDAKHRFRGPSKSELAVYDCPPASEWELVGRPTAPDNLVDFASHHRRRRVAAGNRGPSGPRAA